MTAQPLVQRTERRVTLEGIASKHLPVGEKGTVLFAMYASVGTVSVLDTEASWNQAILGMEPVPSLADRRFLVYWLLSLRPRLQEYFRSNTQDNLNAEQVGNLPYPVLPVAKQRVIADFLDAETARIDALIEKKRRMIELSDERFAAYVEEKTYSSAAGKAKGGPLPDKWRSVLLRRCFRLIQYGIGEATRPEGTTAVLGMGNVDQGEIIGNPGGFVNKVDPSLLLEPGDLLFNRTNSLALVGKVALVQAQTASTATTFASYLVRLRTNHLADSAYLNYLLNTKSVLGQARSMALPSIGQANLNPSRYTSMRIPLPPVQIQCSIAKELDQEATNRRKLSMALARQIELLTEHRQALITAAVTGRLEVLGAGSS
jgi:type I restriction enzyme S subunit